MYCIAHGANGSLEVFLVHPGGPFFAKKDLGAWSIPKGEYDDTEPPLEAAQREFVEETGFPVAGPFLELGKIKQAGGKVVTAWGFAGDCDPSSSSSATPARSSGLHAPAARSKSPRSTAVPGSISPRLENT